METRILAAIAIVGIIIAAAVGVALLPVPVSRTVSVNELQQFGTQTELDAFLASRSASAYYGNYRTLALAEGAPVPAAAPTAGGSQDAKSFSPTNIQVQGVDEADIVKTDGAWIYALANGKLSILRAEPLELVATIDAPTAQNIFLNRDRLVLLSTDSVDLPAEELPESERPIPVDIGGGIGSTPEPAIGMPVPGTDTPETVVEPSGAGTASVGELADAKMIAPGYWRPTKPVTHIRIYDVSNPAAPDLLRDLAVDGWYQDSRLIGDTVYAVSSSPVYRVLPLLTDNGAEQRLALPDIYYSDLPDSSYEFTTILSVNTHTDASEAKAVLRGSSQYLYVSPENIYLAAPKQLDYRALEDRKLEAVIAELPLDVQSDLRAAQQLAEPERSEKLSAISAAYLDSLSPEAQQQLLQRMESVSQRLEREFHEDADRTVIQRIAIRDGAITPEATGEVRGHPLNQFSFDEHNGYLRVATTTNPFWGFWGGPILMRGGGIAIAEPAVPLAMPVPGSNTPEMLVDPAPDAPAEPPEPIAVGEPVPAAPPEPDEPENNLYTLRVSDLSLTGSIEGLAPGERIYSARFLGDRAYLVTFVQIDPLFVIDLSDPAAPRVLGELKIPGYSDYLHPYDATHLIGIGKGAETTDGRTLAQGVKIALFDVSDPANPQVLASTEIGDRGTESEALHDHHAFLFEGNLLALPIQLAEIPAEERGDAWAYGQPKWQGLYAYRLDLSGIELLGRITHDASAPDESSWFDWTTAVHRSFLIENSLYTLSNAAVKAHALADFSELGSAQLPEAPEPEYLYGEKLAAA